MKTTILLLLPWESLYPASSARFRCHCIDDYMEDMFVYDNIHGTKEGGNLLLMASCGPMGIGAIDYAVHGPARPKKLVVTEINEERLKRAAQLISPKEASDYGVELIYAEF